MSAPLAPVPSKVHLESLLGTKAVLPTAGGADDGSAAVAVQKSDDIVLACSPVDLSFTPLGDAPLPTTLAAATTSRDAFTLTGAGSRPEAKDDDGAGGGPGASTCPPGPEMVKGARMISDSLQWWDTHELPPCERDDADPDSYGADSARLEQYNSDLGRSVAVDVPGAQTQTREGMTSTPRAGSISPGAASDSTVPRLGSRSESNYTSAQGPPSVMHGPASSWSSSTLADSMNSRGNGGSPGSVSGRTYDDKISINGSSTYSPAFSPQTAAPVHKSVSHRTRRLVVNAPERGSGRRRLFNSGGAQPTRKVKLNVPESIVATLQDLTKMFPKVSVTAIAEDLMKTCNNRERTIENILNGLESEIPAPVRQGAQNTDPHAATMSQRRRLSALQSRLHAQKSNLDVQLTASRNETRRYIEEAESYMKQLYSFGCFDIVPRFRKRMLFKIHRSKAKSQVQASCLQYITTKLEDLEQRLSHHTVEHTEDDDRWSIPSNVFKASEDIDELYRQMKALDEHYTSYDAELRVEIRSETKKLEPEKRSHTLRKLLTDTDFIQQPNFVYHKWSEPRQLIFDRLMLDQRTKEGMFIQKLRKMVEDNKVDAESIKATIRHLVDVIVRDHQFTDQESSILRLYVHRAVFPLIASACFQSASDSANSDEEYHSYKDAVFRRQVARMSDLTQQEVGIEPKFCKPLNPELESLFEEEDDLPYASACQMLRQLTYLLVPSDMLFCLWNVATECYRLAEKYGIHNTNKSEPIGADQFVPIFLYVTIKAGLPSPYQCWAFMKRFASESEHNSELGYYLTSFQAMLEQCVTYGGMGRGSAPAGRGRTASGRETGLEPESATEGEAEGAAGADAGAVAGKGAGKKVKAHKNTKRRTGAAHAETRGKKLEEEGADTRDRAESGDSMWR